MSSKLFARLDVRRGLAGAAVMAAGLLASCGGGDQIVPFVPTRILAFGDDQSALDDTVTPRNGLGNGRKYSINAFRLVTVLGVVVEDPTTLDCARNPLWIQSVASEFGLVFDRCLGSAPAASGQVLAQAGHKVADLQAQLAAVQGDALGEKDLALVMTGLNDILELYERYAQDPSAGSDGLLDEARARGRAVGAFVNQVATSGPAVVVLTLPDIGKSPYALAQNTSTGDPNRAALISELVRVFNNQTSVTLINNGRLIGLVYADTEIQNMVSFPASYGLANVVDAACLDTAPLPDCTTNTLVAATPTTAAATSTTWLWADGLRLSPAGHSRLGSLAASRARANPF
jgi:hypothetical protein